MTREKRRTQSMRPSLHRGLCRYLHQGLCRYLRQGLSRGLCRLDLFGSLSLGLYRSLSLGLNVHCAPQSLPSPSPRILLRLQTRPSALRSRRDVVPPTKKAIPPVLPRRTFGPCDSVRAALAEECPAEGPSPAVRFANPQQGDWVATSPASRHQWGSQRGSRCWCFSSLWLSPGAASLLTAPARPCAVGSLLTRFSLSVRTAAFISAGRQAVPTVAAVASWKSVASAAVTWRSWRHTVPPPLSLRGTCLLWPCFR
ncbi:hypothetical protein STEG23_014590, partial [Scotinomys teguina]